MKKLQENRDGHEKSINTSLRDVISSAFQKIGYSKKMILHDVGFVGEGGNPHRRIWWPIQVLYVKMQIRP